MKAAVKGFLVRDGDLKFTPKGTGIWKSGLAIQGRERGKDETVFVDVIAFNGLATALGEQELKKGTLVEVEGRLQTETYEGKNGKTTRITLIANDVAVVVRRHKTEEAQDEAPEAPAEDDLDDLF